MLVNLLGVLVGAVLVIVLVGSYAFGTAVSGIVARLVLYAVVSTAAVVVAVQMRPSVTTA